jgi:hypothetical protein
LDGRVVSSDVVRAPTNATIIQAYINKMHGSRSKIPIKNLVRQRCAEGFNSGVKGLKEDFFLCGVTLCSLAQK